ncbi:MAG: rRNA maturation RNase YbeY [Candidatus Promineifilaceae bacterium]
MSRFEIDIQCEVKVDSTLITAARMAVEATLKHQNVSKPTSVTLMLADDARLQQLNRDFLGFDEPTDVLSFPSGESWPGSAAYLGDIAVSIPKAKSQAVLAGHDLLSELCVLTVHGVLHLLDYDHASPVETRRMWSVQEEILGGLDIEYTGPDPH